MKHVRSPGYNYDLNLVHGTFRRWGETPDEDPSFSPLGPELLDVEISTVCDGWCAYCYKSNTPNGRNMAYEKFVDVIEKLNPHGILTQVAFGLGRRGDENPDVWRMCEYLRSRDIMPNGTIANGTPETWNRIAENFGACAVSAHTHWKDWMGILIQNVYELSQRGMTQVNCHFVIAEETYDDCLKLFHEKQVNPMLSGLNAIVLLGLKQCGRASGGNFHRLSEDKFKDIVDTAMDMGIGIGFDSCCAHKFLNSVKDRPDFEELEMIAEPCESMLFSQYVNVDGLLYPCSFNESSGIPGFDVSKCTSFLDEYWNEPTAANGWRLGLMNNGRRCPTYEV